MIKHAARAPWRTTFTSGSTQKASTIFALRVSSRGDFIDIDVYGDGFLYNMVRIIAGTLIDVGKKKHEPEWVREILESRSRPDAGATAPARGLTMMRVYFNLEDMKKELGSEISEGT